MVDESLLQRFGMPCKRLAGLNERAVATGVTGHRKNTSVPVDRSLPPPTSRGLPRAARLNHRVQFFSRSYEAACRVDPAERQTRTLSRSRLQSRPACNRPAISSEFVFSSLTESDDSAKHFDNLERSFCHKFTLLVRSLTF